MTAPKTYRTTPMIPAGSVIGDDPSAVFDSTLTVYSPDGARSREIVAPVDTRSLHSIIPAEILRELGIEPVIESRFNYRDGSILKLPVGPARVALLARTLAGCGCRSVRVVRLDARRTLPFAPVFDRVLVDAPCSGVGTMRRDPDIRWRCASGGLPALAETQAALLRAAAAVVVPGGRLIYATCSSEPEENELVVERLLADGAPFARERPAGERSGAAVPFDFDAFMARKKSA